MKELITTNGYKFKLDDSDFDFFNQWSWFCSNNYCYRGRGGSVQYLHIEIMKRESMYDSEKEIDHKDRDTFNCQKENLRIANRSQQNSNTQYPIGKSGYRGVLERKSGWIARIGVNGRRIQLGPYKTVIEAAKAYNRLAESYYGEFATLNEGIDK